MGWMINLKTDKPVVEEDVDDIVRNLPEEFQGIFGDKQQWGWSTCVDVSLDPDGLHLSGSYGMSGGIAKKAAKKYASELEAKGYQVKIGRMSG